MTQGHSKLFGRLRASSKTILPPLSRDDPPSVLNGLRSTVPDNLRKHAQDTAFAPLSPPASRERSAPTTPVDSTPVDSPPLSVNEVGPRSEQGIGSKSERQEQQAEESRGSQKQLISTRPSSHDHTLTQTASAIRTAREMYNIFQKRGIVIGAVFYDAQEYHERDNPDEASDAPRLPRLVPHKQPISAAQSEDNEVQLQHDSHLLRRKIPVMFCIPELKKCVTKAALLDTGSDENLISHSAMREMSLHLDEQSQQQIPLRVADGKVLYCMGSCQISMFVPEHPGFGGMSAIEATFLVAPDALRLDCIIGWNFIKEHRMLQWGPDFTPERQLFILSHDRNKGDKARREQNKINEQAIIQRENKKKAEEIEAKLKKSAKEREAQSGSK